jgi:two-component system, OmpR family, sensor histidine kinase MtrB
MNRRFASGGRFLLHVWRRSLQLRVVTATILLGVVVVTSLGSYLYLRITDGLVQDRVRAARAEAAKAGAEAQDYFSGIPSNVTPAKLNLDASDEVQQLASVEDQRDVVLLRQRDQKGESIVSDLSSGRITKAIPDDLRTAVVAHPRQQQWRFVSLRYQGATGAVPGVAIGSVVQIPKAGPYEIYSVFSLEREAATAALVRRTFLLGGLVLVLLVGAVAYVVTRQVVSPVRRAVLVAERLSSGRLTERMTSKGEDDLARLGASFNAMAANLQEQIRRLEDLSRVQQRFVSDVSHELRTPLTTIRMAGEILHDSRHDFTPSVARSAELLQTQLDRFESLLSDLLEISRFDAGAAALELEPVDLRDVVSRAVESSMPLAERRGTRVMIEGTDRPHVATVDPRRVERILVNLVVNAIEHGEGRPVTLRLASSGDAVAVAVEDRGVGLREGESELVFNRFWRADPARARTSGGTGLGLAIALEDARLHGGWLQAWGRPGKGSVFRLTLPREAGHPVRSSPIELEPSSAGQVGSAYERIRPADLPVSPAGPAVTSLRGTDG